MCVCYQTDDPEKGQVDSMSDIQQAIDASVQSHREGCCTTRKGCEFHNGMQVGADLAVQMIQISPMADVEVLWGYAQ